MSAQERPDPPYLQITAEIRARILSGDLRPGERMPSIRQIARQWGVAVATATKVMAALRDDGLVETAVGSGTVVSSGSGRTRPDRPTAPGRPRPRPAGTVSRRALRREHVLRAAIAIADVEGLDAVSMRRVAADLGVGPMSLYRHVANKDELVTHMVDEVFGERELPNPGPDGWRAKLELISRLQWELCQRHHWLPRAISFTRPLLMPNLAAYTEWTLRALDGLGLPMTIRIREALTLPTFVVAVALSLADEVEAEQETGMSLDRWWAGQRRRADELLDSGQFPLLSMVPGDAAADLDGLFEYGLARHLDGFAVLVRSRQR
ncbi:GntR family transcriptional regulator [Jiangella gansuensis]|uniref:GntR family transcriptional regulator n=1 Tax=Jiangella gansuensis TaxID=281473 RepID=UPI000478A6E8|nr:GntR family transcriptional regulator [Jiangella gansuensis]